MNQIKIMLFGLLFLHCSTTKIASQQSQLELEIIDISALELRLFNKYKETPKEHRNKVFLDSIYRPYVHLWDGYLGSESDFITWVDDVLYPELDIYNGKGKQIDLEKMNKYFNQTAAKMSEFTGYSPKGKWYIFFGPKWTNLGGFDDGSMLIDLANKHNQSLEDITEAFPHEINHQIYTHTIPDSSYSVISRVIDEGFACFVSHQFHRGKTTIADELYYAEDEYQYCLKNETQIINLIKDNYTSTNEDEIDTFVSRGYKFSQEYPSAIGYFIGFRIVEEYVKKHGSNSWKDIYKLSPIEVLDKSGVLK